MLDYRNTRDWKKSENIYGSETVKDIHLRRSPLTIAKYSLWVRLQVEGPEAINFTVDEMSSIWTKFKVIIVAAIPIGAIGVAREQL